MLSEFGTPQVDFACKFDSKTQLTCRPKPYRNPSQLWGRWNVRDSEKKFYANSLIIWGQWKIQTAPRFDRSFLRISRDKSFILARVSKMNYHQHDGNQAVTIWELVTTEFAVFSTNFPPPAEVAASANWNWSSKFLMLICVPFLLFEFWVGQLAVVSECRRFGFLNWTQ